MEYGIGAALVKGPGGRYRQSSMVRAVSPSEKKAVVHHTVRRKCEWKESDCISIVSIYTKGRLCNVHREIQDARDAIVALEAERARRAEAGKNPESQYHKGDRCKVTAWAKRARRVLVVESTDTEKARMSRYKARVRAGVVIPKKRVETASKLMDKAIDKALRKTATASDIERATKGGKR